MSSSVYQDTTLFHDVPVALFYSTGSTMLFCVSTFTHTNCVITIFYIFLLEEITQLTEHSCFACQPNTGQYAKFLIHKDE